ncbi:RlpA-like double-psi beta-barrel-protein domain-containing protein-containing protein [Sporodiniella umbellata]|nr:RlpA-like double-psi beta-barrel-protein domain-containing protein-containing protein [Sporodiniella umbellata]
MPRTLSLLAIALFAAVGLTNAAPVIRMDDQEFTLEKRGGGTFTGTGTWFLPASEGGPKGACGPSENNNSNIVALNVAQYGNTSKKSKWCGKKIKIKGPKGSTTATINDACPGCSKGDLDLTPVVFKKVIGDMNKGVGKITWSLA